MSLALSEILGCKIVSGADYFIEKTGLKESISSFEVVILCEGKFDKSSLEGKIIGELLSKDNQLNYFLGGQYDLDNNLMREYLLGVNYESCCWAVSIYGRSYYNDLDDPTLPDVHRKKAIMAEFTLKGLGALNNKLASLLENRVLGFNKINQSWTQR